MRLNDFFGYLAEREQVRLRKEAGQPWPWTDDPILQNYKFTNVLRENDATSREFIARNYHTYGMNADPKDILLNCALNRYFGTWEFCAARGWQTYDKYDPGYVEELASDRRERKEKVFTGAYVITNGGISAPKEWVVVNHYIDSLYRAIPDIVELAQVTRSWRKVCLNLMTCEGFGGSGFMAKETLVDTTYTKFWPGDAPAGMVDGRPAIRSLPDDWGTWSPCGPGARRGIARVMGHDDVESVEARSIGRNAPLCTSTMHALSKASTAHLPFYLAPHDIQFGLCEFDKYERVRLGQGTPRSKYRRLE